MNTELYNHFVDATSVMVVAQKYDEAITKKREEWNAQGTKIANARLQAKNAHKSYGKWTGWGVFMLIFGLGNGGLLLFATVILIIQFWVNGDIFPSSALTTLAIVILLPFILALIGMCLITSARIKRKKYKKKAEEELKNTEATINPILDRIDYEIEQLKSGLRQFAAANDYLINFLPKCYQNPSAIGFMLKAIENLRANTLTEVINLYEQELHFQEQARILNNTAEMQRIYNENMLYAMDAMNRNQERINSNLQYIQAMQFISMMDD